MTIALVNPNTSQATTDAMVAIARGALPAAPVTGFTAPFGAPLISNEEALAVAADAVLSIDYGAVEGLEGVIVAAFGDPGLEALSQKLSVPVVGIAQSGMLAAAEGGRWFSVVTTTPDLVKAIEKRAASYGIGPQLASVRLTDGNLMETMADPELLVSRLAAAIDNAIRLDGAEAILIGGGPLAVAARTLADRVSVPLIEPVPEAARRLAKMLS
ncbi:hypothetical protein FMN50_15740 [Rhodobacterales bacterium]|nr:hypothetical protein FMN50_15740 [Rhodobacterales bacterium]